MCVSLLQNGGRLSKISLEMACHGMRHVVRKILNKYEQDDVASKGEDIGMTVDRDIWRKVAF